MIKHISLVCICWFTIQVYIFINARIWNIQNLQSTADTVQGNSPEVKEVLTGNNGDKGHICAVTQWQSTEPGTSLIKLRKSGRDEICNSWTDKNGICMTGKKSFIHHLTKEYQCHQQMMIQKYCNSWRNVY